MGNLTHRQPVWRERSNFLIGARVDDADTEQLWARQVTDDTFELCCIPFFVYNLALGDIVRTVSDGEREYLVDEVVARSDRRVTRVWFGDAADLRGRVEVELTELNELAEWSSTNLLAIDTPTVERTEAVRAYLHDLEGRSGLLVEYGDQP